jgi:hypothetical protein
MRRAREAEQQGHTMTSAHTAFMTACLDSAAFGITMVACQNAGWNFGGGDVVRVYMAWSHQWRPAHWSYAGPDSYAAGTEGQALLNGGRWSAMSTRNAGLLP